MNIELLGQDNWGSVWPETQGQFSWPGINNSLPGLVRIALNIKDIGKVTRIIPDTTSIHNDEKT